MTTLFEIGFDPNGPAMTPAERRRLTQKPRKTGHAAPPGSGPAGETCGSCEHLHRNRMAKTYLKCELRRATWTGGFGTDVRARDAACSHWQAPSVPPTKERT